MIKASHQPTNQQPPHAVMSFSGESKMLAQNYPKKLRTQTLL
jgi:hypothetical protein